MTQIERTLLWATAAIFVVGLGAWFALGGPAALRARSESDSSDEVAEATPRAPVEPRAPTIREPSEPGDLAGGMLEARPGLGSGVQPGLREPSGEDWSNREFVLARLKEALREENKRWDQIADMVAKLETLDDDTKALLKYELEHGNAAGAIQAYERVRDPAVVPDLLRLLDDRTLSDHDRNNVLFAISSIPGADLALAVTGIEERLTRDYAHDLPYLQAIARLGGLEAARAIADAIIHARDPKQFGIDAWRAFDLRKSKEASDHLASLLKGAVGSADALRAMVEFAGRPGATPALVESLTALDSDAQPDFVRRQVLESLARTGDDLAVDRLLAVATKGADYASVAARALASVSSLSEAARAKVIETARTTSDDNLRANAVEGLGNVAAVQAVPLFTEYLSSGSEMVKLQSIVAIGRVGPPAASAIPALTRAYDSGTEAMRGQIAMAVGRIATPEAKSLIKQLLVVEKSERVRRILQHVSGNLEKPSSSKP